MLLALVCLTFAGVSISTAQPVQAISKYSEKLHTMPTNHMYLVVVLCIK